MRTLQEFVERGEGDSAYRLKARIRELEAEIGRISLSIPNPARTDTRDGCPDHSDPPGKIASGTEFRELGERLGILDFKAGCGLLGRGGLAVKGAGADMERAMETHALRVLRDAYGYSLFRGPSLVRSAHLIASGHFPLWRERVFKIEGKDLFPVPRLEAALLGSLWGECIPKRRLPIRFVSAGRIVRRDLGSYGRKSREELRLKEFGVVEVAWLGKPEEEDGEFDRLVEAAGKILADLDLHVEASLRPAGKLSFAAQRTLDFRIWAPVSGVWLSAAAISSYGDFQTRRGGITLAGPGRGKGFHPASVTGTILSLPRVLAAVLESVQARGEAPVLPPALSRHCGFDVLPLDTGGI
jgi:seryl-tRNA synthetase